jgi:hypothetical protein
LAKSSKPSIKKREKERARAQRQLDKSARRADAKTRRASGGQPLDGEDPDLAGIVPGPQPLPPELGGPPVKD